MSLITQGVSGTAIEVEANSRAKRTTRYPEDCGGSFRATYSTGNFAVNAAPGPHEFFSFHPGAHPHVTVVRRILVTMIANNTSFGQGLGYIEAMIARQFIGSDSGGTLNTPLQNKLRNEPFEPSLMQGQTGSSIRISTTAALTPGTRTLDPFPAASVDFNFTAPATAPWVVQPTIDLLTANEVQYPLTLFLNEGFILRAGNPNVALGLSWIARVTVVWDELDYAAEEHSGEGG
jgi:hypothetical protein